MRRRVLCGKMSFLLLCAAIWRLPPAHFKELYTAGLPVSEPFRRRRRQVSELQEATPRDAFFYALRRVALHFHPGPWPTSRIKPKRTPRPSPHRRSAILFRGGRGGAVLAKDWISGCAVSVHPFLAAVQDATWGSLLESHFGKICLIEKVCGFI